MKHFLFAIMLCAALSLNLFLIGETPEAVRDFIWVNYFAVVICGGALYLELRSIASRP